METKVDKHPEPPILGIPTSKQDPPHPLNHQMFLHNRPETFSQLVQCQTGHTHIGKFYKKFIPTKETKCPWAAGTDGYQFFWADIYRVPE